MFSVAVPAASVDAPIQLPFARKLTVPEGLPCPVTLAVNVSGALCATFAELVETVVVVVKGPVGGGGGGGGV